MRALVIDDDDLVRDNVAEVLRADGWEVSEAGTAELALQMSHDAPWALVFCDVRLGGEGSPDGFAILRRFTEEQPQAKIVLMTGHGSAAGALDAVSLGAYDYLMKPFENQEVLAISGTVRRGLERQSRGPSTSERAALSVYTSDIDLIGRSAAFVELMKLVGRVAATNLPILILGESGTGKEVVARAIHRRSKRASEPFVAVNCGAIPAELIESEMFGHVRGSFTGATSDRRGLWQEADGGTIFLDEITETTPAFQVKLLRALQEGEIRRVGSNHNLKIDVRAIAATNRDIERETREGRFRQDLLFRLNAVTLLLPPLRDRREDIMPLARHFASRLVPPGGRPLSFTPEAVATLERYEWPGNIRELENSVVRAAALCDQVIRPQDLPERVRGPRPADDLCPAPAPAAHDDEMLTLAEVEERHVARVLAHTGGNKQAAARALGIDRTTLQRMLKRYNLEAGGAARPRGGEGPGA